MGNIIRKMWCCETKENVQKNRQSNTPKPRNFIKAQAEKNLQQKAGGEPSKSPIKDQLPIKANDSPQISEETKDKAKENRNIKAQAEKNLQQKAGGEPSNSPTKNRKDQLPIKVSDSSQISDETKDKAKENRNIKEQRHEQSQLQVNECKKLLETTSTKIENNSNDFCSHLGEEFQSIWVQGIKSQIKKSSESLNGFSESLSGSAPTSLTEQKKMANLQALHTGFSDLDKDMDKLQKLNEIQKQAKNPLDTPSSEWLDNIKERLAEAVCDTAKAYNRVLEEGYQQSQEHSDARKKFEDAYSNTGFLMDFFNENYKKEDLLLKLQKDIIDTITPLYSSEVGQNDYQQACKSFGSILKEFGNQTNLSPELLKKLAKDLTSTVQRLAQKSDSNSKEAVGKEGMKKVANTFQELRSACILWRKDWQSPDIGHLLYTDKDKAAIGPLSQATEQLLTQYKENEIDTKCNEIDNTINKLENSSGNDRNAELYNEVMKHKQESLELYKAEEKVRSILKKWECIIQKKKYLELFAPDQADEVSFNEAIPKKAQELLDHSIERAKRYYKKLDKKSNEYGYNMLNEQSNKEENFIVIEEQRLCNFEEELNDYKSKKEEIEHSIKKSRKIYQNDLITIFNSTNEILQEEEFKRYMHYTQNIFDRMYTIFGAYGPWEHDFWKYDLNKIKIERSIDARDNMLANTEMKVLKKELDLLNKLSRESYFQELQEGKKDKVQSLIMLKKEQTSKLTDLIREKGKRIETMNQLQDFIEYFKKNGKQLFEFEQKRFYKLESDLLKVDTILEEIQKIKDTCKTQETDLSDISIKNTADYPQIYSHAKKVRQQAETMYKEFEASKDQLYDERAASIERLRFIYKYYRNELHPYWLPEQTEAPSQEEINENIQIFEGVIDVTCVPTTIRSILLQDNVAYDKDEEGKKLSRAFVTLNPVTYSVETAEVPYILERKEHPIPYTSGKSLLSDYSKISPESADYSSKISPDNLEKLINKKDQQGKQRPSALAINKEYMGGHMFAACKIALKECKDNEGISHKVKKILVADPFYGKLLWVRLDDISDSKRCGISLILNESLFPDIDADTDEK